MFEHFIFYMCTDIQAKYTYMYMYMYIIVVLTHTV